VIDHHDDKEDNEHFNDRGEHKKDDSEIDSRRTT